MADLWIKLAGGRAAFQPGQPVQGTAGWNLAQPPQTGVVRLLWYTGGAVIPDRQIITEIDVDALIPGHGAAQSAGAPYRDGVAATGGRLPPAADDQRAFRFDLPTTPYSFSGHLVTLHWAIELVLDDRSEQRDVVMSPTGRVIVLDQALLDP